MAGANARTALAEFAFGLLEWVPETGSTNADLLRAAADGAPDGTVLVADHQTAGRGRRDRTWTAPPGSSLLVSVLVRPTFAADRLPLLGLAMGVAAVDACRSVAGVDLGLKWPNDVVSRDRADAVDGTSARKVAGILSESVLGGPGGPGTAVVVGMGLNVDWPDELPPELAATATSLRHLCGRVVDREELLVEVMRAFAAHCRLLERADGPRALLERYEACSTTLGREVRVELGGGEHVGRAVAFDEAGRLVVETSDGGRTVVAVGDVVHLRPR
ncbi:MAG: biotin--[acetyl-CoA-carboxylase] ligase [Actinomycetota bacterium]|nr:biotin--[acetyl-CoA-carboxylase] ligase [Actinomycetota bacterium]